MLIEGDGRDFDGFDAIEHAQHRLLQCIEAGGSLLLARAAFLDEVGQEGVYVVDAGIATGFGDTGGCGFGGSDCDRVEFDIGARCRQGGRVCTSWNEAAQHGAKVFFRCLLGDVGELALQIVDAHQLGVGVFKLRSQILDLGFDVAQTLDVDLGGDPGQGHRQALLEVAEPVFMDVNETSERAAANECSTRAAMSVSR